MKSLNHPFIIHFRLGFLNHPAIGVPPWLWKPPTCRARWEHLQPAGRPPLRDGQLGALLLATRQVDVVLLAAVGEVPGRKHLWDQGELRTCQQYFAQLFCTDMQ